MRDYDYSTPGTYFVTVCTQKRQRLFGEIIDGEMHLNEYGEIAEKCWEDLPNHYSNIELDVYMIMPDHFHGIISILPCVGERAGFKPGPTDTIADKPPEGEGLRPSRLPGLRPSRRGTTENSISRKRHGLSEFIRAFKSFSARRINEMRNTPGVKLWHRSFYDHVIRNETDLATLRDYILNNPTALAVEEH